MAMTQQQKQDIKEYLTENLTFVNCITSDPYGNNPDQIDLIIMLEGEELTRTTLYPVLGS